MENMKSVKTGRNIRKSFATINEVMEMPNLIEVQKNSYNWFLDVGLKEVFKEIGEIKTDKIDTLKVEFLDFRLEKKDKPLSVKECKERNATYAQKLMVKVRITDTNPYSKDEDGNEIPRTDENGEIIEDVERPQPADFEIKETEIFMGDLPEMTESGTFVINGAERVIISQLIRSPGIYFDKVKDKNGNFIYTAQVIPNRGAWLEYETSVDDIFSVKIDKNKKIPITTFVRALANNFKAENGSELGLATDDGINDFFSGVTIDEKGEEQKIHDKRIMATLEKERIKKDSDKTDNPESAIIEIFKKLRPTEAPTLDAAKEHLESILFNVQRYDLSRVGRYKYNKKLALADRLTDKILAADVVDEYGEILATKGTIVSKELAETIEQHGVFRVQVSPEGAADAERVVSIISNGMVEPYEFFPQFTVEELDEIGINEKVRYSVLQEILSENISDKDELKEKLIDRCADLIPNHITVDDILASINYLNCLADNIGYTDDIDHLGNRRIRSVGELLQNQFSTSFKRLAQSIREKIATRSDRDKPEKIESLINARQIIANIKEFFGSSQLSQFMDQANPLSELTHKRRLSALGPGGLSRDRAGFEVRDVHYTHYGRMCPIESPEGPNIGLISSLATFARINKYGFIEAPFRRVDKTTGQVLEEVEYMTADMEDNFKIAQANEPLDENGFFKKNIVVVRFKDEYRSVEPKEVDFMDVSPKMVVSVATAMIPFLENDDANRALMGANMQRQAVPLIKTEAPYVGTGMESKAAHDSGVCVLSKEAGVVTKVASDIIEITSDSGHVEQYPLIKFMRSNQGTCINQRPIVDLGERVEADVVIADGPATSNGEISLGKNALVGFMTWEGYNYEDAVLINEKLVSEDVYTSIHIEKYEIEARSTKLGNEQITRDIPNLSEDMLKDLDENGIIRVGAEVRANSILVGKITPKGDSEQTSEDRLLKAIFGEKAKEVRDTSLRLPHGAYGTVVNVEVYTSANSDGQELASGVEKIVRCYVAQKRKLSVGDKMAGRHGNKGVVSRILPQEDMPFLADGTPLDIVLNPLGVPSRMNIGQVLEVHLGRACRELDEKIMTPVFDGAHEEDIKEYLRRAGLREDGKVELYDGRTGEKFDNPVTVGVMYYLKLHHLVDDKIHARSTGPYSLVTQQPLGGKAQFGGQRFGEMEVWALEAYGAAYTLQEILTIKSDDVVGRSKAFEAIAKGQEVPKPGIPESFKVLLRELQSLALDVRVYDENKCEIELEQDYLDDDGIVSKVMADIYKQEQEKGFTESEEVIGDYAGGMHEEDEDMVEEELNTLNEFDNYTNDSDPSSDGDEF